MFRTPSFRVDNSFEDEWPNVLVCSMDGVFVGFSVEFMSVHSPKVTLRDGLRRRLRANCSDLSCFLKLYIASSSSSEAGLNLYSDLT